jgi:hypothetical protein
MLVADKFAGQAIFVGGKVRNAMVCCFVFAASVCLLLMLLLC